MSAPAVSILMPIHNGARYLDAALDSLFAQSFADFEIIAADNGSSDGTAAILARRAASDRRLKVVTHSSNRLAAGLNEAAHRARAPLLGRLDADDIAHPDRLERQVAVLAERPELAVLGTAARLIDPAGREIGAMSPPLGDRDIRELHRTSCGVIPSSSLMRAEAFWRAGAYRHGLNVSEDFDLWLRIGEVGLFANLPDPLISYRIHGASLTARQPVRMALASLCVTAAVEARRLGRTEPFVAGRPSLRAALPLLGMSPRCAAGGALPDDQQPRGAPPDGRPAARRPARGAAADGAGAEAAAGLPRLAEGPARNSLEAAQSRAAPWRPAAARAMEARHVRMDAVGPLARAEGGCMQEAAKRAERVARRFDVVARQSLRESSVHPPVPSLLLVARSCQAARGVNSIRR